MTPEEQIAELARLVRTLLDGQKALNAQIVEILLRLDALEQE